MSDKQHLKDKERVREALPQWRSPHDTGALKFTRTASDIPKHREEAKTHSMDITHASIRH